MKCYRYANKQFDFVVNEAISSAFNAIGKVIRMKFLLEKL